MNILCSDHNANKSPCAFYIQDELRPGFCSRPDRFRCEEFIRRKEPVLSPSMIADWKNCRRKVWLGWFLGWQRIEPKPAPLGGQLIDAFMGTVHSESGEDITSELDRLDSLMEYIAGLELPEIPDMLIKANAIIGAYPKLGVPMLKGVPQKSVVKFYDGFALRAIPDLYEVMKEKLGIRLWDWKFVSQPDNYDAMRVRVQAGLNLLLHDAQCITFRIIQKPNLYRLDNKKQGRESDEDYQARMIKDILRRPKHYVQDKTYYRSEFDLDAIMAECKQIAGEIKHGSTQDESWFYANERACYFANKHDFPCDFLEVCKSGVISETLYKRREI